VFAHRIARQAAQSVADAVARKLETVPLDEPAVETTVREEEPITIEETIVDGAAPGERSLLHTLSLISFVGELAPELREVAEAAVFADGDLADAQRALGMSTSEFYRRLREIRYQLLAFGLVDRRRIRPRRTSWENSGPRTLP
jgi:hypothetical protein